MGSRVRPPPAALPLPERGISVGLWAADFDGPMQSRVMQSLLQRFGASRRRVHVRHWRCGRLSQSAAAAADTPQEATIPVSNEEEGSGEPAHQTTTILAHIKTSLASIEYEITSVAQLRAGLEQTQCMASVTEMRSPLHVHTSGSFRGFFGNMSYFHENGQVFRKMETLIY